MKFVMEDLEIRFWLGWSSFNYVNRLVKFRFHTIHSYKSKVDLFQLID